MPWLQTYLIIAAAFAVCLTILVFAVDAVKEIKIHHVLGASLLWPLAIAGGLGVALSMVASNRPKRTPQSERASSREDKP